MELIRLITMVAVGVVGLGLMAAAFAMANQRGGWQQAMRPNALGHWPMPRLLMFMGALLGVVFGLLLLLPGALPWWDYFSPYAAWGYGAVFGFLLGFGLTNFWWSVFVSRRQRPPDLSRFQ
jgi:hypothetical protein